MIITSERDAREILQPGSIANTYSDDLIKVLTVGDTVECVNVTYEDDDYKEAGKPFLRTFADFVGNEIV